MQVEVVDSRGVTGAEQAVEVRAHTRGCPMTGRVIIVERAGDALLHEKLQVYRRNGVREYLVWKVLEKAVVWYHLQDEKL